jgi:S1-C subfamily serine protease
MPDLGLRGLAATFALLALALPRPAAADPADTDAAARGVVRVIIVEIEGDEVVPISHGTGFAVSPERIVTNAHVVEEAREDRALAIGIVPSDGEEAVYARLVSVSPRNDLALLATTKPMRLPPLTISGNPATGDGQVISVGYPMNVDRAQGLSAGDIFRAQPPVKASGALAGRRPGREFDTLLHTAPLARGNSGGPLLDPCGRVVGVNSFGAESGGADAEFYFAISTRELLPFLRANDVTPQINAAGSAPRHPRS